MILVAITETKPVSQLEKSLSDTFLYKSVPEIYFKISLCNYLRRILNKTLSMLQDGF